MLHQYNKEFRLLYDINVTINSINLKQPQYVICLINVTKKFVKFPPLTVSCRNNHESLSKIIVKWKRIYTIRRNQKFLRKVWTTIERKKQVVFPFHGERITDETARNVRAICISSRETSGSRDLTIPGRSHRGIYHDVPEGTVMRGCWTDG